MYSDTSDAARAVQRSLMDDGVALHLNFRYTSITQTKVGDKKIITIVGESGGKEVQVVVDELLLATGRVPNVEGLNLEGAG